MKIGGAYGALVSASNNIRRCESRSSSNRKIPVSKLDRAVPPAELFSAFGLVAAPTKSFLIGYEDVERAKMKTNKE
jgi:hypothetical protein